MCNESENGERMWCAGLWITLGALRSESAGGVWGSVGVCGGCWVEGGPRLADTHLRRALATSGLAYCRWCGAQAVAS